MADLYIMEAANLFAGDEQPDNSNHLTLQELKLPGLEENYVDHTAGGAPVGIEVETHMSRLEATFNLAGWNVNVMGLIGAWQREKQRFTARGFIRDRRTGSSMTALAVMWGRLGRVNPTNFRRGDLHGHEYAIRGITKYKLTMSMPNGGGNLELINWDFFTNTRIINGVNQNAEMNSALGILNGDASAGGADRGGSFGV